jgi:hypothetical protein
MYRAVFLFAAILTLGACSTAYTRPGPLETPGGFTAEHSVERFLKAAQTNNYIEMGYIFGTSRGAVMERNKPVDVERWMYVISNLMQHERYEIRTQAPTLGTRGNSIDFVIRLHHHNRVFDVPMRAVQARQNQWFIEHIAMEPLVTRR